jgi:hypothetical protein
MHQRSLPEDIGRYVGRWWYCYIFFFTCNFALGTAGVALPALIASGLILDSDNLKIVAVATAIISGLGTLLKSEVRADRFHAAWRILHTAKLRFEHDEGYTISEVLAIYAQGEQWIESAFAPMEQPPFDK